jgi:hypothetical protein
VLVASGDGRTAELYDSGTGKFSPTGSMKVASGDTATLVLDGQVLITGGWDGTRLQTGSESAELYRP